MKKNDEFFVPYIEGSLGSKTKSIIKKFALGSLIVIFAGGLIFSLSQQKFKNSTFELSDETKVIGTYYENPYPVLRVEIAENVFKNILLLGFGKSSANPYLKKIREQATELNGKKLSIEGNLIYYNGKTLMQITSDEKISLLGDTDSKTPEKTLVTKTTLSGEIVDPKCYFGVMKPGKGKIHRSCAVLCISGGIPPVLASTDADYTEAQYFLVTDEDGNPVNAEILPFVGKPSKLTGTIEKMDDWYFIKIDTKNINVQSGKSSIYSD